jgi:hypothetical protein
MMHQGWRQTARAVQLAGFIGVLLALAGCARKTETKPLGTHRALNGAWTSSVMTVTFDFNQGTYSGTALGEPFTRKLALVNETPNGVVFSSDESLIQCDLLTNGSIRLTKQGGLPVIFVRDTGMVTPLKGEATQN